MPSASTAKSGNRRCTSSSATRASSRASAAPRQKCVPCPNDNIALVSRRSVEAVRLREHPLVAIGRADEQHHPVTGAQTLRRGARCRRRPYAPGLGRAVVAQRLLDPARDQRRIAADETALLRVAPQPVERVAEELRRRLVAGDDHEEEKAQDLVRRRGGRRRSRRPGAPPVRSSRGAGAAVGDQVA